jgi:ABC-type transporter Mla maintaining outer membrane lipid asymmetry ATPase subunit MlaF
MSVLDNVAYGLKQRRVGKPERHARAREALELVRMTGREAQRPTTLSGGQQQRIALAVRRGRRAPDRLGPDRRKAYAAGYDRPAHGRDPALTLWRRVQQRTGPPWPLTWLPSGASA